MLAEAAKAGQSIQAISTGRNWGFGSFLPFRDGTAIVDFRNWREIGPLDRDTLSVRIQPGVTQGDLHEWLQEHAPDLAFNVTGAGTQTSIIGCALERGLGYAGEVDRSIFGLEVMLSDGTSLQPDPEWFHPARDHASGPLFDGLFFQSNYGIVTAARVRLRVRQEREYAVIVNGALAHVLGVLRECYRRQILTLPTHVSEPGRSTRVAMGRLRELRGQNVSPEEVTRLFPEKSDHVAITAQHGQSRIVNACWRELKSLLPSRTTAWRMDATRGRQLLRLARLLGVRGQADRLETFLPLLGLTWGVPSDIGLHSLELSQKDLLKADRATEGAIYGNGVSALDAGHAQRVINIVRGHWPDAACTYIVMNAHCLVTIFTLHFRDHEVPLVKKAERAILDNLRANGYPPYRLGINLAGPASGEIHARLKAALDPAKIIAPGRYENA
ncbi:FAD-binding protein [Oleiharenicola sp. Vm1]|uniref:FAD-binding protein n=1 Tax=Oleiharenicola sp. Vm1 TaxID=3398393 RepID=UPI0039F5FE86